MYEFLLDEICSYAQARSRPEGDSGTDDAGAAAAAAAAASGAEDTAEAAWAAAEAADSESATAETIDGLGYEVGYRFVERVSASRGLGAAPLDAVKFVCKDLWWEVFKKQVDKLQTNHRGTFVLRDSQNAWLLRLSEGGEEARAGTAARILCFPCGLVRGALANLGIEATVTAEVTQLPACVFNIKLPSEEPAAG